MKNEMKNELIKSIGKICYKIRPENLSHQSPLISEGKGQNSDFDDFENDQIM